MPSIRNFLLINLLLAITLVIYVTLVGSYYIDQKEIQKHLDILMTQYAFSVQALLSHENILQNGQEWRIIDPKGVIGAPIHEVWAFVMDFEKDTLYIADFFGFPLEEVRGWYFVHLMKAACWNVEDNVKPNLFLDLAEKVYPLV